MMANLDRGIAIGPRAAQDERACARLVHRSAINRILWTGQRIG
jgi:hypothetical protein